MKDWKEYLKPNLLDWLLEEDNPSVRFFTLRDLLDKPETDSEVIAAKEAIMETGLAVQIIEKQKTKEYRDAYHRFYTYKYKGLVWQLITLAEIGAQANEHIREQCEYMFENSLETEDGGFAMNIAKKTGGGRKTEVIPCLTGNMVWSLINFGYLDDPRLQSAIIWLSRYTRFSDGVDFDPIEAPYNRYEICWGKHTCFMGVVKALKAFSAIPKEKRSIEVNVTIENAVEFLLMHHIYKQSHNLEKKSKPGWLKFSYPLMYQTDLLEILDILLCLGIYDKRMDDGLKVVISKQDESGRWKMENTKNTDSLLIPMEIKGEGSKWITVRALRVIKRASESGFGETI